MKSSKFLPVTVIVFALVLGACAPARSRAAMMETPTEAMMQATATPEMMMQNTPTPERMMNESPTPGMMFENTATPEMMMQETSTPGGSVIETPTGSAMMGTPAWFDVALTSVSSGTSFKINDYKGKVVLVEMMAVWCTNCHAQQEQIKMYLSASGMSADLVTISLDIDPNENQGILQNYLAKNNFNWTYAVAPAGVSREIGQIYGDQFLNPTSTPMLIIDRKGEAHPLPFGIKSSQDLQKAVETYLNGM